MSTMGEGWTFHTFGDPTAAEPQAQQPTTNRPIAGPSQQKQYAPGSTFRLSGLGKYYNPQNVSGSQFNRPAIMGALKKGVQAYSEAQYFRHAGFGAALRHTLGMPQMPSHMNDYLRARHNNKNVGIDPHSITGQFSTQDPHEYEHW